MFNIGSLIRMNGPCVCKDPRNCHHNQCKVRHIFKDGSAWVHNRHGYARRVPIGKIQVLGPTRNEGDN